MIVRGITLTHMDGALRLATPVKIDLTPHTEFLRIFKNSPKLRRNRPGLTGMTYLLTCTYLLIVNAFFECIYIIL